jgi:hypothetical protein
MQPRFAIAVDTTASVIRITMSGFFEQADIDAFVGARNAAYRDLHCRPHQHRTLVDIRGMKIQSQRSVEAFAKVLADPSYASGKLVFVVEASLARMQIERAAAGRGAGFFLSVEAAEAWLLQP